jgi:hypothetical protein
MARAFEESHAAYARKDGAAAKELSNEGKAHQREMDRLNAEASEWIFRGEYSTVLLVPHSGLYFCHLRHATHRHAVENNRVRIAFSRPGRFIPLNDVLASHSRV